MSVSAPIQLTINGNVDEAVLPDLQAMLAEAVDLISERLNDEARDNSRREHD